MAVLLNNIIDKTNELEEELKSTGLWKKNTPAWVEGFDDSFNSSKADFAEWLQFVFVPNHLLKNKNISVEEKNFLVPHAIKFFGNDVKKGKLLQILIELDSLL
jgi:uncharacterized protein YqcC (DUF446 family)